MTVTTCRQWKLATDKWRRNHSHYSPHWVEWRTEKSRTRRRSRHGRFSRTRNFPRICSTNSPPHGPSTSQVASMAGSCTSFSRHLIKSTVSELARTIRTGAPAPLVRFSAKSSNNAVSSSDELAQGPSCIFVGPIDTASKETLEALYLQVRIFAILEFCVSSPYLCCLWSVCFRRVMRITVVNPWSLMICSTESRYACQFVQILDQPCGFCYYLLTLSMIESVETEVVWF